MQLIKNPGLISFKFLSHKYSASGFFYSLQYFKDVILAGLHY